MHAAVHDTSKQTYKFMYAILHVSLWMLLLSLPYLLNPAIFAPGSADSDFINYLLIQSYSLNTVLLVLIFYIHYLIIIPRFYIRKRYIPVLLFLGVSIAALVAFNYLLPFGGSGNGGSLNGAMQTYHVFMFVIVVVVSFALGMYQYRQKTQRETLIAQVDFLRSQVNPHFLFNMLNSIYALTLTEPDAAPDAVIKLSGLVRYTASGGDDHLVPLAKELEYLKNYVSLQQLRITDKTSLNIQIDVPQGNLRIIPFLLIPFIENAFEYGVSPEEHSQIDIRAIVKGEELLLDVRNTIVTLPETQEKAIHMSMVNTRKRLDLFYPGKHLLEISNEYNSYTISLKIHLT